MVVRTETVFFMPLIETPGYSAPFYLFDRHLETIYANVARKPSPVNYEREVFHTSDGDIMALDWLRSDSKRLVVLAHGLEGDSRRKYMVGMAGYFHQRGWNALAWNCRSCGGLMNKLPKMYHHGETEDISELIDYVSGLKRFEKIALIGFSMGGSIILKYLATASKVPSKIVAAVAVSTPCNLKDAARQTLKPINRLYLSRFLRSLKRKMHFKASMLPDLAGNLHMIRNFDDVIRLYTMPVYGFKNVDEFYEQASAGVYLRGVKLPSLIINAKNDPLLTPSCMPADAARENPWLFLDMPARGGHVGFALHGKDYTMAERKSFDFIQSFA